MNMKSNVTIYLTDKVDWIQKKTEREGAHNAQGIGVKSYLIVLLVLVITLEWKLKACSSRIAVLCFQLYLQKESVGVVRPQPFTCSKSAMETAMGNQFKIDDFGFSDAIDKISMRICKLDFVPA